MISAVNISLAFGQRPIFREVSFHIGPHDRIGLAGSNGAGKTTLLKLLLGEIIPDAGQVSRARYVTVGYLPQEGTALGGRTLYAEVESVFSDVLETRERLEQVQRAMETADHASEDFQELLELFGELQHKLEASGEFRMKAEIEKVLLGLGFQISDFTRLTDEFSGGWTMRIALARLLLQQPSLLLLDEPTNHLDLDSLEWLEDYLRSYEGAVMIVSHDQRFLDNMTRRTFVLSLGELSEYAGNLTAALDAREQRLEQQRAAFKNQQQQIKQTERFIERFRYKATKARQVQSRIKSLERLDRIELEGLEDEIHFAFPPAPPSGRSVLELRGVRKRYGSLTVFDNLAFDIDRGDRIAFVGVNGAGKSTLARIIAGVESFDGGERKVGHNVTLAYYAQHQAEELNPEMDVLQTVESVATGEIRKRLRTLLGSFLFSGDDVFKRVRVLSGGEKSRLALAKMLLQPANLLVMDEPTNHLDFRSKAVLQEALLAYEGSFVIVSHDRDFLDPLVTKVVEFKGGNLRVFPGTVSDYQHKRRMEQQSAAEAVAARQAPVVSERERKRLEAEIRQERYARTRPLQEAILRLEKSIEEGERRKTALESMLADPEVYRDGERAKNLNSEYKEIGKKLLDEYYQWGEMTKELERVNALFEDKVHR